MFGQVVHNNLEPSFDAFEVEIKDRGIQLNFRDFDDDGTHDDMGVVSFTLRELALAWSLQPILLNGKCMGGLRVANVEFLSEFEHGRVDAGFRCIVR